MTTPTTDLTKLPLYKLQPLAITDEAVALECGRRYVEGIVRGWRAPIWGAEFCGRVAKAYADGFMGKEDRKPRRSNFTRPLCKAWRDAYVDGRDTLRAMEGR